jgi:hypothetical protein
MLHGILVATELSDRSADPPARAAMLAAAHRSDAPEHLSVSAPGWSALAAETMARIVSSGPGLVVLGWHAPSWLGRLRNAWTFATIARRSTRPVLVVRTVSIAASFSSSVKSTATSTRA